MAQDIADHEAMVLITLANGQKLHLHVNDESTCTVRHVKDLLARRLDVCHAELVLIRQFWPLEDEVWLWPQDDPALPFLFRGNEPRELQLIVRRHPVLTGRDQKLLKRVFASWKARHTLKRYFRLRGEAPFEQIEDWIDEYMDRISRISP